MSIDRGIDKEYMAHTHTHTPEYYSAIKKNKMPFEAKWMDLEIVILTEVSQTEKEKYHQFSSVQFSRSVMSDFL